LIGPGELKHFHFLKLMLPHYATRVPARRSGFRAETCGPQFQKGPAGTAAKNISDRRNLTSLKAVWRGRTWMPEI
jgi:hypothetical protein